jgi:uncharacterized alpha-E superfamily protein
MLSRVAESLYWMGRYVERAENVSRLLTVTTELCVELEGLDDSLAHAQWDELIAAVAASPAEGLDYSPESGLSLPYVRWLLLDEDNPVSVRHSLARARDNARSVREALTREVFLDLNESFRNLERLGRRLPRDPVRAAAEVSGTHSDIRRILGSIELTLSRDTGWTFLKMGETVERLQRTLTVLSTRLPTLEANPAAGDVPLYYARWRALLRSLASLENYRSLHGASLEPSGVLRFLLFQASSPRSVACGVSRLAAYLERLPRPDASEAARRIVGRMGATLLYDGEDRLAKEGPVWLCEQFNLQLAAAHDEIARVYFRG